jgi:hypothetical protein
VLISEIQPDEHLILEESIAEARTQLRGRIREVFDSAVSGIAINNPPHTRNIRDYERTCGNVLRMVLGIDFRKRWLPSKVNPEKKKPQREKPQREFRTCDDKKIEIFDRVFFEKVVAELLEDGYQKIRIGNYQKRDDSVVHFIETCNHLYDDSKFCLLSWTVKI